MTYFEGKKIIKQDNGQVVVVNRNDVDNSSSVPSEWSLSSDKLSSKDINKLKKALNKNKKRNSKK